MGSPGFYILGMKSPHPRVGFPSSATLATVALAAGSGTAMSAVLSFGAPYQITPAANAVDTETEAGSETFGAWTGTFDNLSGGATRTVTTTNAPSFLTLALSESGFNFVINSFRFLATVPTGAAAGFVSFAYSYSEAYDSGNAAFSYVKNGTATQITAAQSNGTINFAVNPGDTFGFQLSGSYSMSSSATITNFAAPVPEPSALILLATGFTGLIGMRRRRQQAAA